MNTVKDPEKTEFRGSGDYCPMGMNKEEDNECYLKEILQDTKKQ